MIPLCPLFKRKSKNTGDEFLAGNLSRSAQLIIIKNYRKGDGDSRPDFIAYVEPSKFGENLKRSARIAERSEL